MNRKNISTNQGTIIHIPGHGPIDIAQGTATSGATVSMEQLDKQFEKAAKLGIIPPPEPQTI